MSSFRLSSPFAVVSCLLGGAAALAATAGCGSGVAAGPRRESGQSALMDRTFAGQNRCNPKSHERPFVIEWDATDTSSFQARTTTDVVVVRYDGCNLTVLDACNDDSVRGVFGSYKPIEWTSGAVEKVDIANTMDLHAKLPLGEALLGGRVEAGEKFHMEYFVSGTRAATRPVLYRSDLAKRPGCVGATHFVYGINLGAYALATRATNGEGADVSVLGAGVGGGSRSDANIEKKAGDLAACRSEAARELDACKVPIRLTLREISEGENPDVAAAQAEETPAAVNLAGQLQARTDQERAAAERLTAAYGKANAEDGRGCLAELDAHDRLDPRPSGLSTNPKAHGALRARCVMLAGQCAAGRALARKALEGSYSGVASGQVDDMIDLQAGQYCQGAGLTERDRLLVAMNALARPRKQSSAECARAFEEVKRLAPRVTKRDDRDPVTRASTTLESDVPRCFAAAGDCPASWRATKETQVSYAERNNVTPSLGRTRYQMVSLTKELCTDKDQGPMSDAESSVRARVELEYGEPRTKALCAARLDRGLVALAKVAAVGRGEGSDAADLAKEAARCFAAAGDCGSAWQRYGQTLRALDPATPLDKNAVERFQRAAPACAEKPAPSGTTDLEKVAWSLVRLEHARSADVCRDAIATIERSAPAMPPKVPNSREVYDWRSRHEPLPAAFARCLGRTNDCAGGWAAFQKASARFTPGLEPGMLRSRFERAARECRSR